MKNYEKKFHLYEKYGNQERHEWNAEKKMGLELLMLCFK